MIRGRARLGYKEVVISCGVALQKELTCCLAPIPREDPKYLRLQMFSWYSLETRVLIAYQTVEIKAFYWCRQVKPWLAFISMRLNPAQLREG